MIENIYGFKDKTTQVFNKKGKRVPVTLIQLVPLTVKQVKTKTSDGYQALKVGFKKANKEILREIKTDKIEDFKVKDKIEPGAVFKEKEVVKIRGISKGKGFAGVVKRWGFKGGPRTHGQSDRQRAPGSIGQGTDPGRVWKGKRMASRMGSETILLKGLKIFKIDEEKNQLWLEGVLPGGKGSLLEIIRS